MCRQTAAREVVCKVGDGVGGKSGVAEKKGRMGKKKRRDSRKSWGSTRTIRASSS
jgi:hypothetical protein